MCVVIEKLSWKVGLEHTIIKTDPTLLQPNSTQTSILELALAKTMRITSKVLI